MMKLKALCWKYWIDSENIFRRANHSNRGHVWEMVQTAADTNQYAPGAGQVCKPSNAVDEN
jgi:hypothetical protein